MAVPPVTGGSATYTQSTAKLISGALRLCNVIAEDEQGTATQVANALDSLNSMCKGWQATGLHVWTENEAILFLQPKQSKYLLGSGSPDHACLYDSLISSTLLANAAAGAVTLNLASATGIAVGDNIGVQLDAGSNFWTTVSSVAGSFVTIAAALPSQASAGAIVLDYTTPLTRPLRVPAARRYVYSSQIQTPLIAMARLDYDYLPNLYNTGTVTQFFYDPQTGSGSYSQLIAQMNVWPAPADNTNALRFVAQRAFQDFNTLANIPDFPAEWLPVLRWNLAVELAAEYDVPADRFDRLKLQATEWMTRAAGFDREPESVFFGVNFVPGQR